MVAAESSKPYFRVNVRLATGSPEAMNSVTAAYRTERARLGRELTCQIWLGSPQPVKPRPQTRHQPASQKQAEASLTETRPVEVCEILDSFRPGADDFGPAKIRTSF